MAKQSPVETSSNLLEKLKRAKSDQSKRRAITALANFAVELLLSRNSKNLTGVIKISDALTGVIESRTESPKNRIAALRKIEGMLTQLPGDESSTDRLLERLLAVARRRTDDAEVSRMVRQISNRLTTPLAQSSSETAIAGETGTSSCPLYESFEENIEKLNSLHGQIAERVNTILANAIGYRPSTFDEGVAIAGKINAIAKWYGLEILAENSNSKPVTLSFRKIGRATTGAFVFRIGPSTKYAGVALPSLRAVGASKKLAKTD